MRMDFIVDTLVLALKALSLVCDVFTFVPYFITQRPDKVRRRSSRIKAKPVSGKPSDPWRSVDVPSTGLTTSVFPECKTLDDLFVRACRLYSKQPCLGTRDVISEDEEVQSNGKVFKKLVLGRYQWETYEEISTRIINFGNGLYALGHRPRSRLVIFAETRAEWMISAQACFKFNFPVVTLYATLGVDAIIHGIKETEVSFVITSFELLPKFQDVLPKTPKVSHVIVMGCTRTKLIEAHLQIPNHITVLSMQEVEAIGLRPQHIRQNVPEKPKVDDVAVIMYTSGSTGLPKGVVISHRNLMSGTSGQIQRIPGLGENDVYVGYLPLAHVLELSAEVSSIAMGTRIGYSSPTTLTDKSTKIKKGSTGDVSELKPTLVAAVPVIMDRIYKNVWEKVNSSSLVKQTLFKFAYDYKYKHLLAGFDTPLCNRSLSLHTQVLQSPPIDHTRRISAQCMNPVALARFPSVTDLLGGRVRLMLSGGAPLSDTTQRFMNICFCCPVGQGYGLTETCGAGTVVEFSDLTTERVGAPLICCEIRLRDWVEANYTTENKPYPQGEILIGGDNIAVGYYNSPDKTAEDFITLGSMRYFCTGDVGQFEKDGCLRIIDRKKDLVKLQHGEYVSLAQVETVLKMCPLVEQICVVADSMKNNIVALVVPNEAQLLVLAKKVGVDKLELREICKNESVVGRVLKEITNHGKRSKLQTMEIPTSITLLSEPWMPDSGLVTDAFKLKRKVLEEHFRSEITVMYGSAP